jgi:hypothetical protein
MHMQLLSRAVRAWARACAEAAAERRQQAEAAAPAMCVLNKLKLRRTVAAWRQAVEEQQRERDAVSALARLPMTAVRWIHSSASLCCCCCCCCPLCLPHAYVESVYYVCAVTGYC